MRMLQHPVLSARGCGDICTVRAPVAAWTPIDSCSVCQQAEDADMPLQRCLRVGTIPVRPRTMGPDNESAPNNSRIWGLTCNLCGEAHAACTVDASGHHSLYQRPQVLVMHRALQLCESASIAPKVHGLRTASKSASANTASDNDDARCSIVYNAKHRPALSDQQAEQALLAREGLT